MAITAFIGALVAIPAIRISGTYLVVVTLALQVIVIAVIHNWKSLTGGTDGIRGVPNLHVFGYALTTRSGFSPPRSWRSALLLDCLAASQLALRPRAQRHARK